MTIDELLGTKGNEVFSIEPGDLVYKAMESMASHGVGALVVTQGSQLAGILSERDYARKVILQNRSSRSTTVAEIMTRDVIQVSPASSVDECMKLMTENHFRHLPVVDNKQLVGVISIGDLVKTVIAEQQQTIEQLQHYIAG